MSKDYYYEDKNFKLLHGDALLLLKKNKITKYRYDICRPPVFFIRRWNNL